jgi:hypothetical protein
MGLVWPYTGRVRPKVEGAVRGGVQLMYRTFRIGTGKPHGERGGAMQ